jgi:hypothetical protein
MVWISECFVRCKLGILPLRSFSFSCPSSIIQLDVGHCMGACMWALTCLFSNWAQLVCAVTCWHVGLYQTNSFFFSFFLAESERPCMSISFTWCGWSAVSLVETWRRLLVASRDPWTARKTK